MEENNRGPGGFLRTHWLIILILILALALRLFSLNYRGLDYNLGSDDMGYINSGIDFYKTGQITMYDGLSAQIMPGMPVLIGLFVAIFGQGQAFLLALRLFWIAMGVLSILFFYLSLRLYCPPTISALPAIFFLLPDFVWMDQLILTETPFMLALMVMVYATLKMGQGGGWPYFFLCYLAYFFALMLKANIGIYPIFAGLYLLAKKYPIKWLLAQGLVAGLLLMAFIVPWTIRNYKIYDAFIPLTYGAGNPVLLGTYQGQGYPEDEDLDYQTHVYDKAQPIFDKYANEDGTIDPHLERYVWLEIDSMKADYRKGLWWKTDPGSMLKSYLVDKPLSLMFSFSFYWDEIIDGARDFCIATRKLDLPITLLGLLVALVRRQRIAELVFIMVFYMANVYLYSMTFAFDRYAQTLYPLRYLALGLALGVLFEALTDISRKFQD